MNPRIRNLIIAALLPLSLSFVLFRGAGGSPEGARTTATSAAPAAGSPVESPSPFEDSGERSYSYALDLLSLTGFPPDLEPGAPVELWVTWNRGDRAAEPQRWIADATFQRIAAAVTPTGPDVAIIEIPARLRRKMVWADTYGLLAVFAAHDR